MDAPHQAAFVDRLLEKGWSVSTAILRTEDESLSPCPIPVLRRYRNFTGSVPG